MEDKEKKKLDTREGESPLRIAKKENQSKDVPDLEDVKKGGQGQNPPVYDHHVDDSSKSKK